jgi:purine-binding chemotaxis protein CheW
MQELALAESSGIEDTQEGLYLTFFIGEEVFGIGIEYVKEIIGIQPITKIPDFPDHIRGVINLRGKIIPVMDVRLRFKKPEQPYDTRTCIIVVDIFSNSIGLIVDRVDEVVAIPEGDIAAPPEIRGQAGNYIKGFGKVSGEIKLLLDFGVLLGDEAEVYQTKEGE